jgi:hypothetical protein
LIKSLFKISGVAILLRLWARFLRQNLAKQPVFLRFVASNRAPNYLQSCLPLDFEQLLMLVTNEPVAKVGYFCTALAVSQAKACGLKSDETCIF